MRTKWKIVLTLTLVACAAIATYIFASPPLPSTTLTSPPSESVTIPTGPFGPSTGNVGQELEFETGGSVSSEGYLLKFTFDWGDGTYTETEFVVSGQDVEATHEWDSAGTYYIRIRAQSETGMLSSWSVGKEVAISEPVEPTFLIANAPTGPSTGEVNQTLSYLTSASSNVAGSPEYRFDWGDGSYSSWSFSASASHSWSSAGTYTIRAQARLPNICSEWSAGKVVVIEQQALLRQPYGQPEQMKRYITPNDPAVKAAVDEILEQQLKVLTDFETLRDWVAWHISYKLDQDMHGVSNYWQLPSETLKLRTGDCEDFAILLCSLLRAFGVPADQVYVAVGVSQDKSYHAYLVEKWYQGIWRVTEPQYGAWCGVLLGDWLTEVSFETLYCFNDQHYFEGPPTLPPGVYEFQLSFTGGASAIFERYMSSGQTITASVEWLEMNGQLPDFSIFGWGLRIYDASGDAVFSWFGGDLYRSFNFAVQTPGKYKVEVYIGGVLPTSARLTMDPPDWSRK